MKFNTSNVNGKTNLVLRENSQIYARLSGWMSHRLDDIDMIDYTIINYHYHAFWEY